MSAMIWIWILYVLSHDVSNAFFHHVTPDCRKSFSEKQEVFLRNKSRHVIPSLTCTIAFLERDRMFVM